MILALFLSLGFSSCNFENCQPVVCCESCAPLSNDEASCYCTSFDECPGNPQETRTSSLWDRYDDDLNFFLTKADLQTHMNYMHIWEEIGASNDGDLTFVEINEHADEYGNLWDDIAGAIKDLNRDNDTQTINEADVEVIRQELEVAEHELQKWIEHWDQMQVIMGGEKTEITFEEIDNFAQKAKDDFENRIQNAFKRLGGSESAPVSATKLNKNREGIALLLAAWEDLYVQNKTHIERGTYEQKLLDIETDVGVYHDTIQDQHALIGFNSQNPNESVSPFQRTLAEIERDI